jgi:hypothetical protein
MVDKSYQQDLIQRIVNITGTGGLLFVRCHFFAGGDTSVNSITPTAYVRDLPEGWGTFDFFDSDANQEDPKASDKLSREIKNPVTNDMLAVYRYWHTHDTVANAKVIPPTGESSPSTYFVWQDAYPFPPADPDWLNQLSLGNAPYGFRGAFNDPAPAYALAAEINADYPGRIIGYVHATGPPPDFLPVELPIYSGGSLPVHVIAFGEGPPPKPSGQRVVDATVIFNLGKMRASLKDDPITKQKPKDFKFKVMFPTNYSKSVGSDFELKAGTYKTSKPSTPPKETDGRRDFPTHDKEITGIMQFLVPNWEPFPNKNDGAQDGITQGGLQPSDAGVEIKVTFGKELKCELTRIGSFSGAE